MNTSNESTPLAIVKMIVSVLVAIIPFFVTWHKCKLESKATGAEQPHMQQSQAVGNIQSIQSNIQINQSIENNSNQELLAQNEIESQKQKSNMEKLGKSCGYALLIAISISVIFLISSPYNNKVNLDLSMSDLTIHVHQIMIKILYEVLPYLCWIIVALSVALFVNQLKWKKYDVKYVVFQILLCIVAILYIVKFPEYWNAIKHPILSTCLSISAIIPLFSIIAFFVFSFVNACSNIISVKSMAYVVLTVVGNIILIFAISTNVQGSILW